MKKLKSLLKRFKPKSDLESRMADENECVERNFLEAPSRDFIPYLEKNWTEDVDYKSLLNDSQVLLFGDTDHRQTGMMGGLAKSTDKLKDAGVAYLCIEFSRTEEYLDAVREFNESGEVSKIRKLAEKTRTPVRFTRLLRDARNAGLEIYLIDMPEDEKNSKWSEEQTAEERGKYMGQRVSKLVEETGAKVAVFCGYNHLNKNQIPEQLASKGIKHKKFAVVTAGQPASYIPFDQGLISMGAVEAVRLKDLQDRCGYMSLNGKYNIDGFIHFPKVNLIEEPKGNELIVNNGAELIVNRTKQTIDEHALVPLDKNVALPAISYDFKNQVDPSVHSWERTNKDKLFEIVRTIDGITNSQRFYIAIMLENYVRTTARHGGGSVFNIEFDPEARAFGIDTVDTCGYKFNPKADYGGLARHREVTLDTLVKHFDFEDIMVKDIRDIPKTDIMPNPNKPESAYKLILLLSTYATHPERIGGYGDIKICRENSGSENYIAKLTLSDFELDSLEDAMINFAKKTTELYSPRDDLFYVLNECSDKRLSKFRRSLKRDLRKISQLLLDDKSRIALGVDRAAEHKILDARRELQYLGRDSAEEFLNSTEDRLKTYVATLSKIDEIAKKQPILYGGTFERLDGPYQFKDAIKESMTKCHALIKEVSSIKAIDTYDTRELAKGQRLLIRNA